MGTGLSPPPAFWSISSLGYFHASRPMCYPITLLLHPRRAIPTEDTSQYTHNPKPLRETCTYTEDGLGDFRIPATTDQNARNHTKTQKMLRKTIEITRKNKKHV